MVDFRGRRRPPRGRSALERERSDAAAHPRPAPDAGAGPTDHAADADAGARSDAGLAAHASPAPDEARELDRLIPDIDWRVFPPGTERTMLDAPSGPLAHVALGPADGPRVLLVPGVTGSKEDFVLMMPLFADAGYRVESFDLAGQYESDGAGPERLDPPREHYDEQLFLDDLFFVLDRGSAPVHVLGYSFAGTLAQLAMVARPERFASLTLLSAPPEPGQAFRGVKVIGPVSNLTPAKVGAGLMIWGIRRNFNRVEPGRIAFVRERFDRTRRGSVDDIIGLMMHTPDIREDVRRVPVPKLVAVGEHDLWPIEAHAAFAASIGADLAVYPTGHSPCETAPNQLTRDMLALFVRSGFTA